MSDVYNGRINGRLTCRVILGAIAVSLVFAAPVAVFAGPWGILSTEDGKQKFELKKDTIIVGTSKRADVRLRNSTVAPKHIRLVHKAGIVTVHDLGSTTGTLVAGTELSKGRSMQLYQRTLLSLGAMNLVFDWGDRGKLIKPLRKAKPKADPKADAKAKSAAKKPKAAKKAPKKKKKAPARKK